MTISSSRVCREQSFILVCRRQSLGLQREAHTIPRDDRDRVGLGLET